MHNHTRQRPVRVHRDTVNAPEMITAISNTSRAGTDRCRPGPVLITTASLPATFRPTTVTGLAASPQTAKAGEAAGLPAMRSTDH
ncbi:hypothetical protein [Siccirubricoccus sp. G192]|uniref:hypothetical protein n=1 Tax=Siccirubricoccus sp. G192 TaxID=2849651 RepID=UPI001C2B870A|nr:hypothetical protein [Siccirubricoccus sp. G192]MBV1797518.1 hypothetical protein [Siccirubricoccus sp. G192]